MWLQPVSQAKHDLSVLSGTNLITNEPEFQNKSKAGREAICVEVTANTHIITNIIRQTVANYNRRPPPRRGYTEKETAFK